MVDPALLLGCLSAGAASCWSWVEMKVASVTSPPHEVQLSVPGESLRLKRKGEVTGKPEIGRIWTWSATDAVG